MTSRAWRHDCRKRIQGGDPVNMKRTIPVVFQVGAGILIIVAAILVAGFLLSHAQMLSTPAGFSIIRPPDEVSTILVDGDMVWTGGKGGVILFDRINRSVQPLPPGAPEFGYVREIAKDPEGSVWIAHDGGLARFSNNTWTSFGEHTGAPFSKSLSVISQADGSIWVGTEGKIVQYTNGTWIEIVPPPSITLASADVLFFDMSGDLWIGCGSPTYGGLFRYDGRNWTVYGLDNGLPHPVVRDVTESADGAIWVATGFSGQGGVARYSGGKWTAFTTADGLAGPSTRSVHEDRSGRMWIGSEYDGVLLRNKTADRTLKRKDGLAGNEVKVVREDREGTFWIGTDGGLSVINTTALS
jgi:ligand-binding sensor domain-containing protein